VRDKKYPGSCGNSRASMQAAPKQAENGSNPIDIPLFAMRIIVSS